VRPLRTDSFNQFGDGKRSAKKSRHFQNGVHDPIELTAQAFKA
jgi:hypothetical protein